METWKKIQKKNKRNEILGIVCIMAQLSRQKFDVFIMN